MSSEIPLALLLSRRAVLSQSRSAFPDASQVVTSSRGPWWRHGTRNGRHANRARQEAAAVTLGSTGRDEGGRGDGGGSGGRRPGR
jgi:hypothetical protein